MADEAPALVWFRQDLRVADNPALNAAQATKQPLICAYVLDDEAPGRWKLGGASRWWLHHSLTALDAELRKRGSKLVLRRGSALKEIPKLAAEIGAKSVFWNRCYEPFAIDRDKRIKEKLTKANIEAKSFNGALLFEPWEVKTKTGEPYKVFTPFWRACRMTGPQRAVIGTPRKLNGFAGAVPSATLASWKLLPTKPNWAKPFEPHWTPGEVGARAALDRFLDQHLGAYPRRATSLAKTPRPDCRHTCISAR